MAMRMRTVIAIAAAISAVGATAVIAQVGGSGDKTAYKYRFYADAGKTQYLGTVADQGCAGSGRNVYVVRAQVPTPYYDAEPIFVCTSGGITKPEDPNF